MPQTTDGAISQDERDGMGQEIRKDPDHIFSPFINIRNSGHGIIRPSSHWCHDKGLQRGLDNG